MNIQLLIVDDRKEIADQIARAVHWEEYGITPSVAYNGKDALERTEQGKADIVITDIEMPFLSGLEFAKICREQRRNIKIIILSGYDNFCYAKEAVTLGVFDYLLKPVSMQEMLETVLKAKEQYLAEQTARKAVSLQHQREQHTIPVLKNIFFKDLLAGAIPPDRFQKRAELANVQVRAETVCVVELVPHWSAQDKTEDGFSALEFGICNMAKEIFSHDFVCDIFRDGKTSFAVVLNYPDSQKKLIAHYNAYQAASRLQTAIEEYFKMELTAAVSQCYTGQDSIQQAHSECLHLLESSFAERGSILSTGDCPEEESEMDYPEELDAEIQRAFALHDLETTLQKTCQFCDQIMKVRPLPPLELKNKLCNLLIKLGYSHGIETNIFDLSMEFSELSTMEEVEQWMCAYISAMMTKNEQTPNAKNHVEAVKEYIEKNYTSPISLKEISENLYISQSYLSALFKEQIGVNFLQYLTDLRIEKAKELLETSNLKVYEVAERVGYTDTRYFSEIFRKQTGCLPKQWKKPQKKES